MEFDFAQNMKVGDINKVPQDFRGLYSKPEGSEEYVLDTNNGAIKSAVSAITGLNNALKAARLEAKNKTTVDLTPLKDFGATPEEIAQKFATTVEELQGQIKGVNVEKIKQDLASEWSTKLNNATTVSKALETQLYAELVDSRATSAIAEEKGDVELLLPFVRQHIKPTQTNGKYNVNVVDAAGDIRYSGSSGAPMSIKELVHEMKAHEKFGKLFASEAPAGGGTAPGSTTTSPANKAGQARQDREGMSATSKIAAGLGALKKK